MRQYSQIRAQRRKEKKRFSYGDVKKVYTIVLMQKSTRASDKMTDIKKVCDAYPDFCELYREVFQFRYHPKELEEQAAQLEAKNAEIEKLKAELVLLNKTKQ